MYYYSKVNKTFQKYAFLQLSAFVTTATAAITITTTTTATIKGDFSTLTC